MSDIVYNGADVDAGIEIMRGYLDTYDTIQSNIESTASALEGTTGFGLLGSGAKVKTLASSVEDSKNKYTELISSVRAIQMTLMKYDEGKEYMSSFLTSLSDEEWNALTGGGKLNREEFEKYLSGKDYDITTALTLLQVKSPEDDASWWGKLVRGTKTAGLGFFEGILDFGETAVDSVVLGWGCVRALFANNKADAAAIMEETRAKVEVQWSKSVVDNWIDTADCLADVRQFRDTHPEAYNTTRGIAKGLGYATATLLTAKGIGAGVKFLKGSQNLTAGLIAANSGVLGFSSGTEEAWASGADTSAGLKAGLANGAWEAVQWGAGAKINMATEGMGKLGSAIRVGADALTGTVEGGVIDPTKNLLLHSGEEGYTWDQAFEDAGGLKNVASKTAIAGGTSLINEGIDAAKGAVKNHFANKSNAPDAVTAAAKNAVDTPSKTDFADTGTSAVDAPSRSNIADAGTSAVDAPSRSSLADAGTSAVDAPSRSSIADAGTSAVDAPSRSKLADAGTSAVDAPSRSKLADAGTSAVDAPSRSKLADAGSRGNTTLKTQKDALGGETKIWETESNGNVTQRIVEGPTGKTTQTDYTYRTDTNGNTVKETVSQTHGGKNDIAAHVSSRETIDASGNVTSKEVFDANGNSKYTQQMTRNGNEVTTKTTFADGRTSSKTVTTSVDNGKTIKDIEVADASGGTTRTRVTDTVDAAGNKTQVESLKTGYNDQNNKSITSTVEYDATGHVKNKDIGMTEAVVNKRGKTVFEQSRKTVEYENNNGTTRKVTTDFGPKKKDVEINIKQRADANSDTKIVAEKKYKDLNIAEKEYVREQSKKYMKAESGKGFNKYSEAGRGELADRYTRELALKEGKMTPEIRTRAEEMADSVLGSKIPGFNSTNRAGKEALRQEGISDGMEKLIDNPLSKTDTLIYGGKAIARKAATGLGIGLGGLGAIGAVGNAINAGGSTPPYQTLPPTTEPTTPTPPTSGPYPGPSPSPYPSGGDDGNNGGGDDGGNDNTPDTTPITTPDTTPPTIPGDNGNNNSGGNNQGWNNSNGGYEPNPDESLDKDDPNNGDLSDEDKLPDDDNLDDIEDDSIYTIPTITNTDKKVTKDGINAIPILAGLGLAAAAGVGAKIYMDNKKNNDNGEEEYDDEFQSDSDYMSDSDFDTLSSQDSDLIADDWKEESAPQEGDESLDYEKPSFYSDTLGEEI